MSAPARTPTPALQRVLVRRDIVLLVIVAVFNLNVVPSAATIGGASLFLWLLAMLLFLWPESIAVVEFSKRFPGEGGIYLWTKNVFGDFHGFLCGWCYVIDNILYLPTLLLYFAGVLVFMGGPRAMHLGESRVFLLAVAAVLVCLLVTVNVAGLALAKWIGNFGAIGSVIAAMILIGLGVTSCLEFGTTLSRADFAVHPETGATLNTFGLTCFALVGLELASIMGDEIRDPRRILPSSIRLGGAIAGVLYLASTLGILLVIPKNDVNVLQGIVQSVAHLSSRLGVSWLTAPFAALLALSTAGIASAWLSGCARIPFVAGLDSYLPPAFARLHPRFGTPHVALIFQGAVGLLLCFLNFVGAGIEEAFQTMLSLAVVLQLIPFLYLFAALLKVRQRERAILPGHNSKMLWIGGTVGFLTTAFGLALQFLPPREVHSVFFYELKMIAGTLLALTLASWCFLHFGRQPRGHLAEPSSKPAGGGQPRD